MGAEMRPEAFSDERVSLEGRRMLRATGVKEILRFEEALVVLQTAEGLLVVRGEGLALRSLAPEDGRVEVRGKVESLSYAQGGQEKGLLRRLFG